MLINNHALLHDLRLALRFTDLKPGDYHSSPIWARLSKCLKEDNLTHLGEIISYSDAELLRLPNLGRKCLNALKTQLKTEVGLEINAKLSDDPDVTNKIYDNRLSEDALYLLGNKADAALAAYKKGELTPVAIPQNQPQPQKANTLMTAPTISSADYMNAVMVAIKNEMNACTNEPFRMAGEAMLGTAAKLEKAATSLVRPTESGLLQTIAEAQFAAKTESTKFAAETLRKLAAILNDPDPQARQNLQAYLLGEANKPRTYSDRPGI